MFRSTACWRNRMRHAPSLDQIVAGRWPSAAVATSVDGAVAHKQVPRPGPDASGRPCSSRCPRTKSRNRMAMNEKTNASVAALPTPSAPALELKPAVATDQRDRRAEEVALEDPGEDVQPPDVSRASASSSANESTPSTCVLTTAPPMTPMKSAIRVKQRDQQHAGQESRDDQVIDRVGPQRREGVDLLGDAHRAQLGGHRRADPARRASSRPAPAPAP